MGRIVAIDIDDTLANFTENLLMWHNLEYDTNIVQRQIRNYKLWEIWGGTKEDATEKLKIFYKSPFFKIIKPNFYAEELINKLSEKNNEVIAVSARPCYIYEETKKWLEKYFKRQITRLILTNPTGKPENKKTKKEICEEIGAEVIIEDIAKNTNECAEIGMLGILLTRPWNESEILHKSVNRINSLDEIITKSIIPL